jgi:hypothetical protein
LQFISLDKKFDRCAMVIKEGQGEEVAQAVQGFIQSPSINKGLVRLHWLEGTTNPRINPVIEANTPCRLFSAA